MVLGVTAGLFLGNDALFFKPIGALFLNLISMIIVPLVFSTMVTGMTAFNDNGKLGRIGLKATLFYMGATVVAVSLALSLGLFFDVGSSLSFSVTETATQKETLSFASLFLSLVPSNPIAALATGNILQIVVFAFFFGLAIHLSGEKGKPVQQFIASLADIMYAITRMVMEFSPIGVFAIMAWVAGTFGMEVFLPLLQFTVIYYLGCILQIVVVYGGILFFIGKLKPMPFFRGIKDAAFLAFTTCSSSATLPVTLSCVEDNLGASKNISSFVLPLGLTLHMTGAALFQAMSALFIAHAYGIDLDLSKYGMIALMSILGSIGAAGIPGTGFIMLSAVLSSVGLPLEGLVILAGIDRIREMGSTLTNVLGEAAITVVIAKQENELDETLYYGQKPLLETASIG